MVGRRQLQMKVWDRPRQRLAKRPAYPLFLRAAVTEPYVSSTMNEKVG